jgi:hypothetical protein
MIVSNMILLWIYKMTKIDALVNHMRENPHSIRFKELEKVCEHFFGKPRQKSTSHQVYKTPWPGDPRVNIQNDHGQAKIYQVKQVLKAIAHLVGEHGHE